MAGNKTSCSTDLLLVIWEFPVDYRSSEKIALSHLPNDLVGIDDLECFGVVLDVSDSPPVTQSQ